MRLFFAAAGLLALIALWWLKFDRGLPEAAVEGDNGVAGRRPPWVVEVRSPGRSGLRRVDVRLRAQDRDFVLAEQEFPATNWLGSAVDVARIPIATDLAQLGVPEGPAELEVRAETHSWRLFSRPPPIAGHFPQTVDRTPPRVELLSEHHNARLGGTLAAVFRLADAVDVSVRVGNYRFPVFRDFFADESLALALFAIPEDLTADVQPILHAVDAAGNDVEVFVPAAIQPREFRRRTLEVDDGFLQRKIPPLLTAEGLPLTDDLLDGYLTVNREVRARSEEKLRTAIRESHPNPLWQGAFQRMSRSQTMSEFGDRRSYSYAGDIVDHQTHLGVDLASLQRAEVGAAQDGVVVFAGPIGIYGETVVVDHGLHVFTLYGHLSSIAVAVGDSVTVGQTLGNTGQSGLAGGDHLHFSVIVNGVHVDPIEWWDPKWMRERLMAKIEMFPRRGVAAAEDAT